MTNRVIDTQTWGLVNLVRLGLDHFALTSQGLEITRGTADFCKGYAAGFDDGYFVPPGCSDE